MPQWRALLPPVQEHRRNQDDRQDPVGRQQPPQAAADHADRRRRLAQRVRHQRAGQREHHAHRGEHQLEQRVGEEVEDRHPHDRQHAQQIEVPVPAGRPVSDRPVLDRPVLDRPVSGPPVLDRPVSDHDASTKSTRRRRPSGAPGGPDEPLRQAMTSTSADAVRSLSIPKDQEPAGVRVSAPSAAPACAGRPRERPEPATALAARGERRTANGARRTARGERRTAWLTLPAARSTAPRSGPVRCGDGEGRTPG
jgi:hypothetical protein